MGTKKMDGVRVEWFLAPRDVAPDSTIVLGKLIVDPFSPEGPPYLAPALPVSPSERTEFNYPWTHEKENERGGTLGLFASFMSYVGVGGELSANLKFGGSLKIEVDRLQTLKFEPSDDYLEKSLNLDKNLQFLKDNKYRKPVYIVTGTKTAYSGRVTRTKSTDWGGDGNVGVSPHVPGLQVGPKGSYTQHTKEIETVQGLTNFVFGFRLNKVHYSKRKRKMVQEKFVKGATYSREEKKEDLRSAETEAQEQPVNDEDEAAEFRDIEVEYAGEDEFDVDGQNVVDEEDGQPCVVILPQGANVG